MDIAYGHGHLPEQVGIQTGQVSVSTVANEVTTVDVLFPQPFAQPPQVVVVSPMTSVPYTAVRYAAASTYTETGFKLHIYRTGATTTGVAWLAVGRLAGKTSDDHMATLIDVSGSMLADNNGVVLLG